MNGYLTANAPSARFTASSWYTEQYSLRERSLQAERFTVARVIEEKHITYYTKHSKEKERNEIGKNAAQIFGDPPDRCKINMLNM